jgi:molecular chaperone DnaK
LEPDAVQEILLVGGQTRMPLIRRTIAEFFNRQPREDINPDEIVAMGAAVQSAILKGKQTDLVLLLDVTPFSLGIETEDDTFEKIIERNSTIPTRKTMPFTTVENNQVRVTVHVLQGEYLQASKNKSLARFDLIGIQAAPAGMPQIDVTFEIDADGLLRVSAKDVATGLNQEVQVRPSAGLSRGEIEDIIDKNRMRP